ncbi:MAG: ATP-binding protein [Ferruginibacter sp.]
MTIEKRILKILIVEDDEDDFFLINEKLRRIGVWQFEVKWIFNYDEAIEALRSNYYTICFSDYRLGVRNGIDLIKEAHAKISVTPVILLTGKGTHKIDMEATKAGAFDYLVKDEIDEDKLERTIRYALERINSQEKLMQSEHRYRSFFEKSKDIVFIAERDTTITTINAAISELLGFTEEELTGKKKLIDFFQDEDSKELFNDIINKNGAVENFEVKLLGNSEEIKTGLINASLENVGDSEPYVQGIIHDITDMRKAELSTMQNEKLAATKRFIHTLAHEVRNPLKNIKMAVNQLLNPNNKVDDKILLEIVERSEVKIDNLITELLQSSNASAMNWQVTSFRQVLDNVVAAVQDKAFLRNIQLVTSYDEADFSLNADGAKLEMAILNIVVNAIEAVEDGVGKIKILFRHYPGRVVLLIKDNGSGISPENKAKLFEPYFTSKRNGIGLGLATTLAILKSHKAKVEVESELGKGTVFSISFSSLPDPDSI